MTRLAIVAALLLAGCAIGDSSSAPAESDPATVSGTVSNSGLTLTAVAEPATVSAGEEIRVQATLSHGRPAPLAVHGSGTGVVFFSVTRLEDGLSSGPPAMQGDCVVHELPAGEGLRVAFSKSGGFSADDPHAEFRAAYFSSPDLTLPAGTWRIDVVAAGSLGEDCGGPLIDLELSLPITVRE